jgi:pimeloyl-ACP methyl ester carboxylesterase
MLLFMRYGAPMLMAVADAELAFLPGVGHVPMVDDPALVARAIFGFIDTVDRRLGLTPQPSGEIP